MATRPLVIGGGWAGLAAAVELAARGLRPLLLESAPQLGGRARTVTVTPEAPPLDNGQHLLIGAYRETLALLARLGVDGREAFHRTPFDLPFGPARLRAPALPAPLHLAAALATARAIPLSDKLAALRLSLALRRPPPHPDLPAAQWLAQLGQGGVITRLLWSPLCLAALNTPLEAASARLLQRVLREAFSPPAGNADLLIPARDLGALLAEPARAFIAAHGGEVRTRARVKALTHRDGALTGVELEGGELTARHAILAVNPEAAARLLAPLAEGAPLAARITRLGARPITTLYLRYGEEATLDPPMQGFPATGETPEFWLFDRRVCGQRGWFAAVVSADERLSREAQAGAIIDYLRARFPAWEEPREQHVIRERRATFDARPGIDALRPGIETPLAGLLLAGDYTATGLPATLEGAVRSGRDAAARLIAPPSTAR